MVDRIEDEVEYGLKKWVDGMLTRTVGGWIRKTFFRFYQRRL